MDVSRGDCSESKNTHVYCASLSMNCTAYLLDLALHDAVRQPLHLPLQLLLVAALLTYT